MNGRRIECARGKVVGGSSAINAMAYYHGHRSDYDRWSANRLPGWLTRMCGRIFAAPKVGRAAPMRKFFSCYRALTRLVIVCWSVRYLSKHPDAPGTFNNFTSH